MAPKKTAPIKRTATQMEVDTEADVEAPIDLPSEAQAPVSSPPTPKKQGKSPTVVASPVLRIADAVSNLSIQKDDFGYRFANGPIVIQLDNVHISKFFDSKDNKYNAANSRHSVTVILPLDDVSQWNSLNSIVGKSFAVGETVDNVVKIKNAYDNPEWFISVKIEEGGINASIFEQKRADNVIVPFVMANPAKKRKVNENGTAVSALDYSKLVDTSGTMIIRCDKPYMFVDKEDVTHRGISFKIVKYCVKEKAVAANQVEVDYSKVSYLE